MLNGFNSKEKKCSRTINCGFYWCTCTVHTWAFFKHTEEIWLSFDVDSVKWIGRFDTIRETGDPHGDGCLAIQSKIR